VTAAQAAARLLALPRTRVGNLGRVASASFGLNVLNLAATVGLTALLARTMTVDAFGLYSWVVAIVTLLTIPAVLGVDRLLVRDVAVHVSRSAFADARGLIRWTSLLVLGVSLAIAAAGVLAFTVLGNGSPQWAALLIGLVALPFVAAGRVTGSALMGGGHVVIGQAADLVLRPVALIALVVAAVVVLRSPIDATTAVALFAVSAAVALAVGAYALRRRVLVSMSAVAPTYRPREWAAAAVALTLLSGAALINTQMGVALLGVFDTPDATGLYAVAQRGALLVAFPLMAVNAALAPTAARLWAAREIGQLQNLVTRSARGSLVVAIGIALVFAVAGRTLLGGIFGSPFEAATGALAILTIGQVFNVATGSVATLLIMSGHQWRAGLGIVAGAVLNGAVAIFLIPTLHAEGAAIAATASLVVSNLIHVVICRRTLGIDPSPIGLAPLRIAAAADAER
jgi:O-antigen/teichoic acid export membrane protein